MYKWIDKYIEEQRDQSKIIKRIIAPCTIEQINEIKELDELEMSNKRRCL